MSVISLMGGGGAEQEANRPDCSPEQPYPTSLYPAANMVSLRSLRCFILILNCKFLKYNALSFYLHTF